MFMQVLTVMHHLNILFVVMQHLRLSKKIFLLIYLFKRSNIIFQVDFSEKFQFSPYDMVNQTKTIYRHSVLFCSGIFPRLVAELKVYIVYYFLKSLFYIMQIMSTLTYIQLLIFYAIRAVSL